MDCFNNTFATVAGDVAVSAIRYRNGSIFVWVSSAKDFAIQDFHCATPDKYVIRIRT